MFEHDDDDKISITPWSGAEANYKGILRGYSRNFMKVLKRVLLVVSMEAPRCFLSWDKVMGYLSLGTNHSAKV